MRFIKKMWSNLINYIIYTCIAFVVGNLVFELTHYFMFDADSFNLLSEARQDIDYLTLMIHHFFVGCTEETAFRYIIMDKLLKRIAHLPIWIVVFLSSIFFGLVHLGNAPIPEIWFFTVPQVVMASFLGVVFAHAYFRKGLWLAVLVHASFNILTSVPVLIQYAVFVLGIYFILLLPILYWFKKRIIIYKTDTYRN